jgi:hypothetical protein
MEMGDQRHDQAALPPGKKPGTIAKENGFASRLVRIAAQSLAPTGI